MSASDEHLARFYDGMEREPLDGWVHPDPCLTWDLRRADRRRIQAMKRERMKRQLLIVAIACFAVAAVIAALVI